MRHRLINNLSAFFLIATLQTACTVEEKEKGNHLPQEELLEEGDLVFRRGSGMGSRMVLIADSEGAYSHIGIIVCEGKCWKVIHAVPGEPDFEGDPDRVKMESLAQFFATEKAIRGAIMRVKGDSIQKQRAAGKARQIFRRGTLFDHEYDYTDTTQMYCTELIDFVYSQTGINLTEGRISRIHIPGISGNYVLPSDIQQSQYLELIYSF